MAQLLGASGSKKRRRWGEEPEEADAAAAAAAEEEEEDRISALPEDLRMRILALLPLKSAIRTGALSTRWRALWARRWPAPSSLDLDFRSGDDPERLLESLERRGRRRLDRFSLTVHLRDREDIHPKPDRYLNDDHLDRCLGYAASCDVADLRIDIEDHMVSVFSELSLPPGSSQLARISLRCVSCVHIGFAPSDAFSALEVISLYSVISIDLDNLLAACPQLRTLDLRYCQFVSHLGTLSVNAARGNLRSLTVAECDDITHLKANMASGLRSFCLSSAQFPTYDILATAVLDDLYINLRGRNDHPLEHWIKALPNLTVLTICSFALQRIHALAILGSATCLTKLINLWSLRELQLLMFAVDSTNLAHIYEFLRMCRCPKMERLFVQLPTSSQDTFIDKSLEIAEEYEQGAEQSEECEPDAELPKEDEQDEELSEDDEPDAELPKDDGPDAGLSEEYKTDKELSEEYETEEELSSKELLEEYTSLLYEDVHEEDPSENVLEDEQSNEDVSEHGLNNLVFAKMVLFKDHYFEMRLASFLLRKATGLKKLVLVAPEGNHMEALEDSMDTPRFLETELLRLKNVSTNAQIVLSDSAPDANQPLHSDVFASFWFSVS